MVLVKTVVLILSVSAVSAEFPPRTSDVGSAVKDMFQKVRMPTQVFNGRRLQATGAMSDACSDACAGVKDFLELYMNNMEATGKGDFSWMCPKIDVATCMTKEAACQEEGKKGDEEGMATIDCMCNCPVVGRMEKMSAKDYCEPANDLSCMLTTGSCSAIKKSVLGKGSDADFKTSIDLHCQQVKLGCVEKNEKIMECSGDSMTKWMSGGCEDAAISGSLASKADECCPHGETVVKCMGVECIKLGMKATQHKAKDADAEEKKEAEKEMNKNFEIGKVCTGTGMPADASALEPPADAASSNAWETVHHAIPFVAMVGGLLA